MNHFLFKILAAFCVPAVYGYIIPNRLVLTVHGQKFCWIFMVVCQNWTNHSSWVCINVSNSPNPSPVYIRLCKHGKRFLLLTYNLPKTKGINLPMLGNSLSRKEQEVLLNQMEKATERSHNNPGTKRGETCCKIPFLITPTYWQTIDNRLPH